ncbi:hypothetical protein XENTR_v10010895 [Xenopus tropicalis]|uniref:Coiled-coil domain containing 34 n=1 Tax=Xenopus tropicalis TaxID=8364 RepID=A0A6I8PR30_XENTR|nr:coiled-coil domain-containing protein 34 [Xenopus tropicalis]XP_004913515.1 coiled-coil domain-containing protein 34 [Xenopus tropicalis]XP_031756383.1 coiled-coil domain-containing protein 34 [Xenopus tropicalis]KAE8606831.1 hypothetical protein XENTR_v10010895 [Xenopus tropicalis]KAE8606832.1 hypothetical protein XENTR_v10010895 [Xenopus tropicalis]KAE8606833.1 hypothetical protein XENTR_v10010895 [Xenopus tropicalis]|eukprot:XP_002937720.1 PREDICTED: coiled-coil domain-containing protein 34 [Xenopus tropicalis]
MSCSPVNKRLSDSAPSRSHSTPHGLVKTERRAPSRGHDLSVSADSTSSLLSPIYHESYESDVEDVTSDLQRLKDNNAAGKHRAPGTPEKGRHSQTEEHSMENLNLTPWEAWLLHKEKEGRIELQRKISEELKQEEERLKEQRQKEMKKKLAEEQRKEWVRKKKDQEQKERDERLLKEQQDKEAEELRRISVQEKANEKFEEWLRKKKVEEQERKKKEKEEEEKFQAAQRDKKDKASKVFKEWLEQAKDKPRPTLNSYGYVNGKLTGYYDASSYPAPGFYNPIPWKPIHIPPPPKEATKNLSAKKKKRPVSSQLYRPNVRSLSKPKDNLHVGGGIVKR